MSNNSPARRFLDALEKSLTKHRTLRGRPGDPKAPGDKRGYRIALPPHKELGGRPGPLRSQKPHGKRGLDTQGSVQTLMILLRKAAEMFRDKSIAGWNDMLEMTEQEVWEEGERVFGGADRVRELIDSLPERGAGENLNVDDVPENLLEDFFRGASSRAKAPKKTPEPKEPQRPKFNEEAVTNFLDQEDLEDDDVARLLEQISNEDSDFYEPSVARFVWDWVLDKYNFDDLTLEERERFFELSYEQKIAALIQLGEGKEFSELNFSDLTLS
jgi:hypothetical protein